MTGTLGSILMIAGAVLTIDATSVHAQPAKAAAPVTRPFGGCDDGEFCIYEHRNGTGLHASMGRGTDDLGDSDVFGGVLNDKTSAVWNRSHVPWCLYEHADGHGHNKKIEPGFKGSIAGMVEHGFHWNDKVSAIRPARYELPSRGDPFHC